MSLPEGTRLAPCQWDAGLSRGQILGAYATLKPLPSKKSIIDGATVGSGPPTGRRDTAADPPEGGAQGTRGGPGFKPLAEILDDPNEGGSKPQPQRPDDHRPATVGGANGTHAIATPIGRAELLGADEARELALAALNSTFAKTPIATFVAASKHDAIAAALAW